MKRYLPTIFLITIFGLPSLLTALPLFLIVRPAVRIPYVALLPLVYALLFVLTAGLLSRPWHKAIVPGVFPRDLSDPAYMGRRLYGVCWTSVYYFKPIYFLFLSVPILKRVLFRLFGYKGAMDFTVYPDTWIRDLPLLSFGKGAYLSNRATIGTNIVLRGGTIFVDRITVDEGALIGHLAVLAPGVHVGKNAEVGVRSTLGIHAVLQERASIGAICNIGNSTTIGRDSRVESGTNVGHKIAVPPNVTLSVLSTVRSEGDLEGAFDRPSERSSDKRNRQ